TVLQREAGSRITLFYANRDEASIIFRKALDTLSAANGDRLKVFYILDAGPDNLEALYTGLMTSEKVDQLMSSHVPAGTANEYFICGPGPMMENVKKSLEGAGIPKERIHIEYFTAVLEDISKAEASDAGEAFEADITVIMDDEPIDFKLNSQGDVILDAASDAGVDAPFSCKGAVCCTCKAKVLEGQVVMDKNFALSDKEVEDGYILTCQSHPATPKVVITYDVI
ncbi:MAG: 2Fe-2S iron-sulfur cluster binding domain-containing protein, partial [Flavobacteriales bacterium]|nr:2Fe-2S iron-sulfur cluster binding domain-containing protein [Flavobacteriales bacterium]